MNEIEKLEAMNELQELVTYKDIVDKCKQNLQSCVEQAFEALYRVFRQNMQQQKIREVKLAEEYSTQKMQLVAKIDEFFDQQKQAINQDTPQQWIERFNQLKELTGKGILEIVLQKGPTVEQLQFEIEQLKSQLEVAHRTVESVMKTMELPVFVAEK